VNPKLFLFPINSKKNDYIEYQKSALERAAGCAASNFKVRMLFNGQIKKNDLVVLNWFENSLVKKGGSLKLKGMLRVIGLYLGIKRTKAKLIWVKHNKKPHNAKPSSINSCKTLTRLIEHCASKVVVHSRSECVNDKYCYVPHPLYSRNTPLRKQVNNQKKIILFGAIAPYKAIAELLTIWPSNTPLLIAGSGQRTYIETLNKIIKERDLPITIVNKYIEDDELEVLLSEYDVSIIPHPDNSAIVSGAFFHAKTFGHIIIKKGEKGCASYADQTAVYFYDTEEALASAIVLANGTNVPPSVIYDASLEKNSEESFNKTLNSAIKSLN
jgi:beta-1,4-mannosyltransferase